MKAKEYEEKLKEIQDRIVAALEAKLALKTIWNQNGMWVSPERQQAIERLEENALDDMIWMMQELVSTRAMLFAKEKRVNELKDQVESIRRLSILQYIKEKLSGDL